MIVITSTKDGVEFLSADVAFNTSFAEGVVTEVTADEVSSFRTPATRIIDSIVTCSNRFGLVNRKASLFQPITTKPIYKHA